MEYLVDLCKNSKKACASIRNISSKEKDAALLSISELLVQKRNEILEENKIDVKNAKAKKISDSLVDRLILDENRIINIASSIKHIVSLPDPVGEIETMWKRPNKLQIGRQRVPLGVIGVIYESRPNVTVDAATLCLKAGNTVILRGGSDAINTNKKIVEIIREALTSTKVPADCVQLITNTDHETANEFMKQNKYVDVLIPRGGHSLIQSVIQNATIPVIETGVGNCHIYVDKTADLEMAKNIIINAKTSRPGVCNACETLLIDEGILQNFLPILNALADHNVEIRGCEKTGAFFKDAKTLTEDDLYTEFLDLILAVKVVSGIDEAIDHINTYGTRHSECIVTSNYYNSQKFLNEIDAAAVYVNASTRFTDGDEFGFGAEIGISTQKLHARGPLGLKELTTTKYIIYGNGQIR